MSDNAGPAKMSSGKPSKVDCACVNCRASKVACNGENPCSRCIARGMENSCKRERHKKRGRKTIDSVEVGGKRQRSTSKRTSTPSVSVPTTALSSSEAGLKDDLMFLVHNFRKEHGKMFEYNIYQSLPSTKKFSGAMVDEKDIAACEQEVVDFLYGLVNQISQEKLSPASIAAWRTSLDLLIYHADAKLALQNPLVASRVSIFLTSTLQQVSQIPAAAVGTATPTGLLSTAPSATTSASPKVFRPPELGFHMRLLPPSFTNDMFQFKYFYETLQIGVLIVALQPKWQPLWCNVALSASLGYSRTVRFPVFFFVAFVSS